MKNNYFFKAVFTLIMCGSISLASAADIYLSNSGLDTNDGLSAGAPVKTLSKAFTMSLAGDVIHVMNMININEEPVGTGARATIDITGLSTTLVLVKDGVTYTTWNAVNGTLGIIPHTRSVTLVGDDRATCGFDGNNASCIIRQDHGSIAGTVITYKNLTFKNGKSNDASGGGGFYFRGGFPTVFSTANFENCDFTNNTGNQIVSSADAYKAGGGVTVIHGNASFKKCAFSDNKALRGGGLYMQNGTVAIDSCVFKDNDLSSIPASYAGAIFAGITTAGAILNLDIKNTSFINNKAATYAGALSTVEVGTINSGQKNIKFTNCAFVNNTAVTGLGGAVFLNNVTVGTTQDVSFINTTFYNNTAGANTAGAIAVNSLLVNSKFNMINCTVSGNKVAGITGAAGVGVRFLKGSSASVRKIQNSILENNTAVDANMTSAADYADLGMEMIVDPVTFVETKSYVPGTSLIIEKSLIGSCKNADFETDFPMNKANYVFELNGSIVNSYKAKLGVYNEEMNYFPLLATSEAIAYGSTATLSGLTPAVMIDQIGRYRPATNCSAGAYEYETVAAPTGVKNILNNSMKVYRNANNQLVVTTTETNAGTITVCNTMGQQLFSTTINGATTTINKSLTSGVYLVLLNVNGKISSQKVMMR